MRNILCRRALLAAALAFMLPGCGGGPTAPAATASGQADVVAPVPTPAPPTPAPVPAPEPSPGPSPTPPPAPSPAPIPTPAPAPMPDPTPTPAPLPSPTDSPVRYDAHVTTVQWYGSPLFTAADIEIVRYNDRIVLGAMTLRIVFQDDRSVIARTPEMTFSAVESTWSFNGVAGQGAGTWSKREP